MLQRSQSQFFVRCEGKDTFSLLLRGCSVKLARLNILTYFSLNVPQKYIKIYKISIIIYKRDAISAACVRPFLPISSLLLILLLVFVFVMPGPGHLPPHEIRSAFGLGMTGQPPPRFSPITRRWRTFRPASATFSRQNVPVAGLTFERETYVFRAGLIFAEDFHWHDDPSEPHITYMALWERTIPDRGGV